MPIVIGTYSRAPGLLLWLVLPRAASVPIKRPELCAVKDSTPLEEKIGDLVPLTISTEGLESLRLDWASRAGTEFLLRRV